MIAASNSILLRDPMSGGEQLELQCPSCGALVGKVPRMRGAEMGQLVCSGCPLQISSEDGIWDTLPRERKEHYALFTANYEAVRAAEGRGSRTSEFYLALPDRDITGRNQAQWDIRRRTFECLDRHILPISENELGPHLDVLDLGAGNCWLSYRFALRGHRPVAVDLLINPLDGLGAAHHYRSRVPYLFPRFRAELDRLPFADGQFDIAIFNASFHYSEDYARTLKEALRCLRRPGYVVIADTAWYRSERSGLSMLEERRNAFQKAYGFASDALDSLEFLTDERLRALEQSFGIRWTVFTPSYGWRWRLRPLVAKVQGRREPSTFRIYVAKVAS